MIDTGVRHIRAKSVYMSGFEAFFVSVFVEVPLQILGALRAIGTPLIASNSGQEWTTHTYNHHCGELLCSICDAQG